MEEFFKKHAWTVKLAGLAVVVAFAGSAVATWFGARSLSDEDPVARLGLGDTADTDGATEEEDEDEVDGGDEAELTGAGQGASTRDDPRRRASLKQGTASFLVARNLFCPTCQPVVVGDPDQAPAAAPLQPGVIKSLLPLALIATMESDDPTASMATIADTQTGALGSFEIADTVRPGVTIDQIGRGRVVLKNGEQLEYILMSDRPPEVAKADIELPDTEDRAKKKSDREIEGAEDAISCEGDSCTVDRAFVNKMLSNPALLAKQARVVPSIKDGETRGFKFYGVRPGSLPKLLGVKNGDLVKSINGQPLTSVDEAMGMYTKLRNASSLSVVIERRGATVTKDITIK